MSSGMNVEQAKEYAKTMTYLEAVSNVRYSKGIKYRKATMIKLRELAEIADRLDRKTENSSEKPNNCEVKNYCDDCLYTDTCDSKEFFYACTSKATISKMEQVDKDINVRCKEPQTIRCPKCGRTDYIRDMEKDMGIKGSYYKYKCINCNTYIKDEP